MAFSGDQAYQVSCLSSSKLLTKIWPELYIYHYVAKIKDAAQKLCDISVYSSSHRLILFPLYFCLSHRLTIMHWYLYPIPVVPAYCSLFLFLFFTAIGDFHTADSWKASCEWISKPEKSTWPISDWYFTSARSGLEMWYSDWFRKGSFITFEMVQMGRNQKN